MVQVSDSYNPYNINRHVSVETQLRIIDESAADNATASSTLESQAGISSIGTIATDELYGFGCAYATLEEDYLRCDKRYSIMPDDWHGGFWSEVSGSPTITFSFPSTVNCIGLTVWFDPDGGQWPASVSISADGEIVSTVSPSSGIMRYVHDYKNKGILSFQTLKFTFTRKSNRRIRVSGIMFGIVEEYKGNRLISWRYSSEADHLVQSIPATEQTIEVLSDNGSFRLTDPEILPCIHSGLRMKTKAIVDGESVQMADTIMESIRESNNGFVAEIKSYDIAYYLGNVGFTAHSSSNYDEWQGGADGFVAKLMKMTTGLYGADSTNGIPYTMPESKKSIQFYPHRESNTVRAWLYMAAQAIGCHVFVDKSGIIRFVDTDSVDSLIPSTVATINKSNSKSIETTAETRVNMVEVETAIVDADDPEEVVGFHAYINNRYSGESENKEGIANNLMSTNYGVNATKWMLKQYNRRVSYTAEWRGDPAIDLFDIININGKPALVTSIDLTLDSYFRGTIKGVCSIRGLLNDDDITGERTHIWNP